MQHVLEGSDSSWFGFSMILEGTLRGRRAELVHVLDERGIDSRPIVAGNFAKNPVMEHLNARGVGDLSNADRVHDDGLFVGNHHYDITPQLESLRDAILQLES